MQTIIFEFSMRLELFATMDRTFISVKISTNYCGKKEN